MSAVEPAGGGLPSLPRGWRSYAVSAGVAAAWMALGGILRPDALQ